VLRIICGPKGDEIKRGWRKLHTEELYNFYSLPNTILITESRRARWAGHTARMGIRGMHAGFWWES
jgi:hypothetical protein